MISQYKREYRNNQMVGGESSRKDVPLKGYWNGEISSQ